MGMQRQFNYFLVIHRKPSFRVPSFTSNVNANTEYNA